MTNEQTVLQIVKLIQGGKGYLTKQGQETMDKMIQQHLAQEHTGKVHSFEYSIPKAAKKKARTHV